MAPMTRTHDHSCCCCGWVWSCVLPAKPRQKVCPVDVATKINGDGPYCPLCRSLIEATRAARMRGMTLLQAIQSGCGMDKEERGEIV